MTMKGRLEIHKQMENANKTKINRWKAKEIYRRFCRAGQFLEARMVLELLRYGSVTLRLYDEDWNVQTACEKAGLYVWYSSNGYRARAYIEA